jgi:rifampicin phosphotransferase
MHELTGTYVVGLEDVDGTQVAAVGGMGAQLGRIEGTRVPAGFCVTTDAFRRIVSEEPSIDDLIDRLPALAPDDRASIGALDRPEERVGGRTSLRRGVGRPVAEGEESDPFHVVLNTAAAV